MSSAYGVKEHFKVGVLSYDPYGLSVQPDCSAAADGWCGGKGMCVLS